MPEGVDLPVDHSMAILAVLAERTLMPIARRMAAYAIERVRGLWMCFRDACISGPKRTAPKVWIEQGLMIHASKARAPVMFNMTACAVFRFGMKTGRRLGPEIGLDVAGDAFLRLNALVRCVAGFAIAPKRGVSGRQRSRFNQRGPTCNRAASSGMGSQRDDDDEHRQYEGIYAVEEARAIHSQRNPK